MKIYLAGNFEQMDNIESELRMINLVIERASEDTTGLFLSTWNPTKKAGVKISYRLQR